MSIKPIIIVSLHIAPPLLGVWGSYLWDHDHEAIAAWLFVIAGLLAIAALMRDLWQEEIVEALSPTRVHHYPTAIEPARPLPAFDDQPSRVRIKPIGERIIASVAPEDGDPEQTWPEVG